MAGESHQTLQCGKISVTNFLAHKQCPQIRMRCEGDVIVTWAAGKLPSLQMGFVWPFEGTMCTRTFPCLPHKGTLLTTVSPGRFPQSHGSMVSSLFATHTIKEGIDLRRAAILPFTPKGKAWVPLKVTWLSWVPVSHSEPVAMASSQTQAVCRT